LLACFPSPAGSAAGDAAILRFLESQGYAAERCAAAEPMSVLGQQDVLVTGYLEGVERSRRVETIRRRGGRQRADHTAAQHSP